MTKLHKKTNKNKDRAKIQGGLTGDDRARAVKAEVVELTVGPHRVKHGHLAERSPRRTPIPPPQTKTSEQQRRPAQQNIKIQQRYRPKRRNQKQQSGRAADSRSASQQSRQYHKSATLAEPYGVFYTRYIGIRSGFSGRVSTREGRGGTGGDWGRRSWLPRKHEAASLPRPSYVGNARYSCAQSPLLLSLPITPACPLFAVLSTPGHGYRNPY